MAAFMMPVGGYSSSIVETATRTMARAVGLARIPAENAMFPFQRAWQHNEMTIDSLSRLSGELFPERHDSHAGSVLDNSIVCCRRVSTCIHHGTEQLCSAAVGGGIIHECRNLHSNTMAEHVQCYIHLWGFLCHNCAVDSDSDIIS